jgi:hypothetical protein
MAGYSPGVENGLLDVVRSSDMGLRAKNGWLGILRTTKMTIYELGTASCL